MMIVNYNPLAKQYSYYRKPDPGIRERIHVHLRDARSVLNIGAGTGSYEPGNCPVVSLEPSYEMISRRKNPGAIPVQGRAEELPFKDTTFDCSMGILTMHHWMNISRGLKEMQRVTKNKIVLFTWTGYSNDFWLLDYLPEIEEIDKTLFISPAELDRILGGISIETVEIPGDCTDGFMCAYWKRPEMYLDPNARKAISTFSRLPEIRKGLNQLREDIDTGVWREKYGSLLEKDSLDLGYRLVTCEIKT